MTTSEANECVRILREKKQRLIDYLLEPEHPEVKHLEAERLLLEFVGKPEITAAWESAKREWWYS